MRCVTRQILRAPDFDTERARVLAALRDHDGDVHAAARALGIVYPTMLRRIRWLDLWGEIDVLRRAVERRHVVVPMPAQARHNAPTKRTLYKDRWCDPKQW